jgi:hypothetical protein
VEIIDEKKIGVENLVALSLLVKYTVTSSLYIKMFDCVINHPEVDLAQLSFISMALIVFFLHLFRSGRKMDAELDQCSRYFYSFSSNYFFLFLSTAYKIHA